MILDTDVLIWYFRGNARAKNAVEDAIPFSISVVTYMELVQGMKSKDELRVFQKHMQKWNTQIIQIDQSISARAMFYVEEYALSHAMMLADALIAATAVQNNAVLLTGNEKHYKFVPNLLRKKFTPA